MDIKERSGPMKRFDSDRVQDKLIDGLDRKERQKAYQMDRFFKYKLPEIHNRLTQALLMEKIIETDNPGALSELILKGMKRLLKSHLPGLKTQSLFKRARLSPKGSVSSSIRSIIRDS